MSGRRNANSAIVQGASVGEESWNGSTAAFWRRVKGFALLSGLLVICFSKPLYELVQFSFGNSLYSHIPLIPFISAYLVWLKREKLEQTARPSPQWAVATSVISISLLGAWFMGVTWAETNYLPLMTLVFLLFFFAGFLALFGGRMLGKLAFPAGLLFFMIPFPEMIETGIERFFQHTSAGMSHLLINASNIPVLREELRLYLPGIALEVAPECSGIRSTLVLFITSLLAGHFFLKNNWNKAWLTLAVIPLGILRNAIRIATLANLSVRVNPDMIHSPLHTHGGPVFFILSMVPLLILLIAFRKREARASQAN